MLKKPIKFENFDGEEVTETHYFNLSKGELAKMELTAGEGEGFIESLKDIARSGNPKKIIATFEELIHRAYGLRSEDGTKFYKNEEILKDFIASPAYDALFLELCTDASAAVTFINGVVPVSMQQSEGKLQEALNKSPEEFLAELEKTPGQIAEERSRAALRDHVSKSVPLEPQRVADPIVQPPAIPTQPQFQAPIPPHPSYTERADAVLPTLPVQHQPAEAPQVILNEYNPNQPNPNVEMESREQFERRLAIRREQGYQQ